MMPMTIPAGDFKARCLSILDDVAETGIDVIVTKRGRPIARLVPLDWPNPPSLVGSVRFVDDNDDLLSTGEVWDATQ